MAGVCSGFQKVYNGIESKIGKQGIFITALHVIMASTLLISFNHYPNNIWGVHADSGHANGLANYRDDCWDGFRWPDYSSDALAIDKPQNTSYNPKKAQVNCSEKQDFLNKTSPTNPKRSGNFFGLKSPSERQKAQNYGLFLHRIQFPVVSRDYSFESTVAIWGICTITELICAIAFLFLLGSPAQGNKFPERNWGYDFIGILYEFANIGTLLVSICWAMSYIVQTTGVGGWCTDKMRKEDDCDNAGLRVVLGLNLAVHSLWYCYSRSALLIDEAAAFPKGQFPLGLYIFGGLRTGAAYLAIWLELQTKEWETLPAFVAILAFALLVTPFSARKLLSLRSFIIKGSYLFGPCTSYGSTPDEAPLGGPYKGERGTRREMTTLMRAKNTNKFIL